MSGSRTIEAQKQYIFEDLINEDFPLEIKMSFFDFLIPSLKKYLYYIEEQPLIHNISFFQERTLFPNPRSTLGFADNEDTHAIRALFYRYADVDRQLGKMETGLRLRAGSRFNPNIPGLRDYVEGEELKHGKLLTGFIGEWAVANGFAGLIKLDGLASDDTFSDALAGKRLIKDKTFRGQGHGEEPHFVQLFVVTEQHKDKPFLSKPPAEFYAWMGEQLKQRPSKDYWFWTFEIHPTQAGRESNRDVFGFHEYLMSDNCMKKFPVLCQLIRGREAKKASKSRLPQVEFKR